MTTTKRSSFLRIISILMVFILCFALVTPAFAASSVSVNTRKKNCQDVYVSTGSGWMYRLGWKKTTVTIRNTGKGNAWIYEKFGSNYSLKGTLSPGQTKYITLKGSGQKHCFTIQRSGDGSLTTVSVSTNAGYVY